MCHPGRLAGLEVAGVVLCPPRGAIKAYRRPGLRTGERLNCTVSRMWRRIPSLCSGLAPAIVPASLAYRAGS